MGRPLRINKAEPRGSAPVVVAAAMAVAAVVATAAVVAVIAVVVAAMAAAAVVATAVAVAIRPSGARGWEDRSYGARDNAGEGNAYDEGRSRRRRGSSSGDDYSGYGGAEG